MVSAIFMAKTLFDGLKCDSRYHLSTKGLQCFSLVEEIAEEGSQGMQIPWWGFRGRSPLPLYL